ncbi:MAG: AI-2E family transporter [Lachnospiraceae bacterium]|nr:AI-2E family transporter [Lachnospiraceae bacterium]
MKFSRSFKDNKWLPYAIAGCSVVLFYLLASHINYFFFGVGRFLGFISPVIIGLIIAYIMDPLVKLFEMRMMRKAGIEPEFLTEMYRQSAYPETADSNALDQSKARKVRFYRVISVWITVVVVVLVIVILLIALIPQLVKSAGIFISNFDSYADSLQLVLNSFSSQISAFSFDISSFAKILDNSIDKLADYVEENMGNIVNKSVNVGMTIFNLVISFILAIYMLCDKRRLQAGWRRFMQALLPERTYQDGAAFWIRCNNILIRYIAGDLLDGLIVGMINFVFMSFMKMDYASLISVIVGLTNLAPTFGPLAGAIIGGFVLVFVNPWWALWFLIFTIILQTVDGYIIKPKLFGNSLGISSLWILISIIVLGRMFGVAGILLAIPAAAIFDIFYKEAVLRRLEAFKAEKNRMKEEERAKKAAEEAAIKAAKEAIKAVVQKDGSHTEADDALKERLASDADTIKNDI